MSLTLQPTSTCCRGHRAGHCVQLCGVSMRAWRLYSTVKPRSHDPEPVAEPAMAA